MVAPSSAANPVGWVDDDTLGCGHAGRGGDRTAWFVETGTSGTVEREIQLDLPPRPLGQLNQWSATLSPDHARIAVTLPNRTGTLVTLSTEDGSVVRRENVGADDWCSTSWAQDGPVFLQSNGDTASLGTSTGRPVMTFAPGLGVTCALAAADALAGERHQSVGERLFGDSWLSWYWRQVGLGLLGGLAVVGGLLLLRRRRFSG